MISVEINENDYSNAKVRIDGKLDTIIAELALVVINLSKSEEVGMTKDEIFKKMNNIIKKEK